MRHEGVDVPNIYGYGDYRRFITDWYIEQKDLDKSFSLQTFADAAGFKTKTFLFKVMHGEKALTGKRVPAVTEAMGLKKGEADFFALLVQFNESTTVEEREHCFTQLRSFKYTHRQMRLRADQFAYFSKWYHAVVREVVTILDFHGDYRLLARAVVPRIRPQQAEASVKLLLKLGLIEQLPTGLYRQTETDLTTGDELVSTAVQRFQKDMLARAGEALDTFPQQQRDISTLTMGLSKEGFRKVKHEIQAHRKCLVGIARQDEPAERVYQLNMQFFPVSKDALSRASERKAR